MTMCIFLTGMFNAILAYISVSIKVQTLEAGVKIGAFLIVYALLHMPMALLGLLIISQYPTIENEAILTTVLEAMLVINLMLLGVGGELIRQKVFSHSDTYKSLKRRLKVVFFAHVAGLFLIILVTGYVFTNNMNH